MMDGESEYMAGPWKIKYGSYEFLYDEEIFEDVEGAPNILSKIGQQYKDAALKDSYRSKASPFENCSPGRPSLCFDFYEERNRCIKCKKLFEDPEFPAVFPSIFPNKVPACYNVDDLKNLEWLRPSEIIKRQYPDDPAIKPQLIVNSASRSDAKQGALEDCYMIAATATLAMHEELFYRVVPPDQDFSQNYAGHNNCGIFHFRFWRYSKWVDVVIDDRLPFLNGKLLFMKSRERNEFWSSLLEKAYAKMYGSYESLNSGFPQEVMRDFTGGLVEAYNLKTAPKKPLMSVIKQALYFGSLIACGILGTDESETDRTGLQINHAYTVVAIDAVEHKENGAVDIIRIRNPYGAGWGWKGEWCDKSSLWDKVDDKEKLRVGYTQLPDGEFWMSFTDFMKEFTMIDICTLNPESLKRMCELTQTSESCDDRTNDHWYCQTFDGAWSRKNKTCGGSDRLNSFENPQYFLELLPAERDTPYDGKCTVIMTLTQKYVREKKLAMSRGVKVFRCMKLYGNRLTTADSKDVTIMYRAKLCHFRDITKRMRLEPGYYLIVPVLEKSDTEGELFLTILSEKPFVARELTRFNQIEMAQSD